MKIKLTFSAINKFMNCRSVYYKRYVQELVSKTQAPELGFGTIWHGVLEGWYLKKGKDWCFGFIDSSFPNRGFDYEQARSHTLITIMFDEYIKRYETEVFTVEHVETQFCIPIINPDTGRASRTFELCGKIDGVVSMANGDVFIVEHKTASSIDGSYIDKLPMDLQINLYAYALSRRDCVTVSGVVYNAIAKAKLVYNETKGVEEYADRLRKKYAEEGMWLREHLLLSQSDLERTERYIWKVTQKLLAEMKDGDWLPNTDYCFKYNKPCEYFELCRSGNNHMLIENFYDVKPAHVELQEVDAKDIF